MRETWIIIMLMVATCATAQSIDSTETKLQRYKHLYEQGEISEEEYTTLKRKALDLKKVSLKDRPTMPELKKMMKKELIAGSAFAAAGTACIITGHFISTNRISPDKITNQSYGTMAIIGGTVMDVIAAGLLIKGVSDFGRYHKMKMQATITPEGHAGLRFTF